MLDEPQGLAAATPRCAQKKRTGADLPRLCTVVRGNPKQPTLNTINWRFFAGLSWSSALDEEDAKEKEEEQENLRRFRRA